MYYVFEHVDHTLSFELLLKPRGLPVERVKVVLWQLLQAVSFLHSRKVPAQCCSCLLPRTSYT